ncbi:MAG: hypothetical protein PHS14_16500 [Elusimicrobia bacterium]|nr:hypothetical protein [Elusimicrobiota bacterium]
MNCENARRRISETLDEASQDAAVSRHLAGCAACSRALALSRSLNAALASLPQLRPSAAFSSGVLASLKRAEREECIPAWPLAAAWAASSVALAAGAMRLSLSIPRLATAAAKCAALTELAGRLALHALPTPRAGAEFSAAALLAVALFLAISMPHAGKTPLIGAKS